MFEQLLSLKKPLAFTGVIESVKGGTYLAMMLDNKGNLIEEAPSRFKSLELAKAWLKTNDVHTISLRQSPAYFEMIGLDFH